MARKSAAPAPEAPKAKRKARAKPSRRPPARKALGTPQFVRLKIGVGRPAPRQDTADYVLEPLSLEERASYEPCLERAVDALELLLNRDIETAMNQFNVREKAEGA